MTNTQPTYFYYSVAAENNAFSIITKTKLDEEVVTDILWNVAPFRCNVCDVEELSYEEALEESPNYDDSSLFISDDSKGWDEASSQLKALMIG